MRLFVAVELGQQILEALQRYQAELRRLGRGVTWSRPEGIHCTLQFLGEVDPSALPSLEEALAGACRGKPFLLTSQGTGVFPGWSGPRVLWAGIGPVAPDLSRLQVSIGQALAPLGFPPEDRPFKPHLTLGRVRDTRDLGGIPGRLRQDRESIRFGEVLVDRVILFQSTLRPEGAEYKALSTFPLKGDSE